MAEHALRYVRITSPDTRPFLATEKDDAVRALCDQSSFQPANTSIPGPYDLDIGIQDGRLVMDISGQDGARLPTLILSVKPYTRLVRDYFMMIESYEKLRHTATAAQLEPVDMARRGLHNEGADLVIERLRGKVDVDHATARRIFTLICALHGREFQII